MSNRRRPPARKRSKQDEKINMGGSPGFFIQEALGNVKVNGFMSFAAMSIIAICILIMGSISLVALNANRMVTDIREASQIRVFIDTSISRDDYGSIYTNLLNVTDVREAEFLSKEDSFESFKEELGDNSNMLDGLEEDNPLRDGYIVYLTSLENVEQVTEELTLVAGIANVESDNAVYTALSDLEKGVQLISFILVIALSSVSIFIIANTVKLAMYSRKGEIAIMKMIGATDMFIRWPFIIEGLILGVCGSIIAFFGQWVIYNQSSEVINTFLGFVEVIPFNNILGLVLTMFMALGAVIGVLGSTLTIRKFLHV